MRKTVIAGVGNVLMKDEGAGPKAVEMLSKRSLPGDVELVDAGVMPFEALAGRGPARLILVDAARGGGAPGTVYVYRGGIDGLEACRRPLSLHDADLPRALAELALAGEEWSKMVLFGIEPEDVAPGEELSPPVERALAAVVEAVEQEVVSGRQT